MSLGTIIFLAVWLPPIVPTWRRVAYLVAWNFGFGKVETEDKVAGVFVGLLAGCVWFVVVPIAILVRHDRFFLPPREKRAEVENERLQARIRELEREVGIRG